MSIGKRIKQARTKKGLTQASLAQLIGTTKGAIGNYENGTSHPKEPILLKLIEALEVDANFLFQDLVRAHDDELEKLAQRYNLSKDAKSFVKAFVELEKKEMDAIIKFLGKMVPPDAEVGEEIEPAAKEPPPCEWEQETENAMEIIKEQARLDKLFKRGCGL
ncbi:MAG: helix-turn-helix domain-containing protein [Defluviitaleaceae bacterium]|nr:helix-turn-helix domain-containing protein [Defluviitaleaceae bacterium]